MIKIKLITGSKLTTSLLSFLSLLTLVDVNPAQGFVNGDFENGDFTGWETTGNTKIETFGFGSGPTDGNFEAFLSTEQPTVYDSVLEEFLGLPTESLGDLNTNDVTLGSAIKQTFTAKAGDILTFDWNFLTNENRSTFFNDFSFVSITGLDLLADTFSPLVVNSLTPFLEETEFQTFSFTFDTAGTYTLGLGVVNVADSVVNSGLLIDNVELKSESVPESTSALSLLGLVALGTGSICKRQQK